MHHRYQIVFKLPEDCPLKDLDIEDDIAVALGNENDNHDSPHLVDGHSMGGGSIEFFIHTNAPQEAFALCKPLLQSHGLLDTVVVAWCESVDRKYQVIWPIGFTGEFEPF